MDDAIGPACRPRRAYLSRFWATGLLLKAYHDVEPCSIATDGLSSHRRAPPARIFDASITSLLTQQSSSMTKTTASQCSRTNASGKQLYKEALEHRPQRLWNEDSGFQDLTIIRSYYDQTVRRHCHRRHYCGHFRRDHQHARNDDVTAKNSTRSKIFG
jgi:hypothetical protein